MAKNKYFQVIIGTVLSLTLAATAGAVPVTLNEVFLGTKTDGDYFAMSEGGTDFGTGNKAKFNFDLTGSGGVGQLFAGSTLLTTVTPTRDETGLDLSVFTTPYLAYVDFFISDYYYSGDGVAERVRINIETGELIKTRTFTLENDPDGQKRVRVDLAAEGLLDLLADGRLLAMAIAPAFGDVYNTFSIDRVRLHAEAETAAPVPEPATLLLLGAGMLGLAGFRRKFKGGK